MSNPNPQNPYPGYPNSAQSPYPAAAGPGGGYPGATSRRASSRTLPIIAGIGVAVGVFGGLMIIRGTGNSSAASNPEVTDNAEKPEGDEVPVLAPPDAGAAVAAATADAATKAATPPEPETRQVTLRFNVAPKTAAITIDGEAVKNGEMALELAPGEKKEVEIEAMAEGYEPWSKTVAVATTGTSQTVEIALEKVAKKPVASNSGSKKPPRPREEKPKPPRERNTGRRGGSGGLIDL
jgi:hypothetical protein